MLASARVEILTEVDAGRITALRDRGVYFWLHLADPSDEQLNRLPELLPIHPLAIEDTREFDQRVKLDDYQNSALLVFYGAEPAGRAEAGLVEVHVHLCEGVMVTVTRRPLHALDDVLRRVAARPESPGRHPLYRVLDGLVDSILTSLEDFDDQIDTLQESLVEHASAEDRQRIFGMRRHLARLRQVVVPERDLLAERDDLVDLLSGMDPQEARNRLRDVEDHLARAAGLIGTYRDQLGSLLDLYLTEMSNGMNKVMTRLTVIATVFLPLTFLTGFFGMNFAWLVKELTPTWTFFALGIGLSLVATAALALYLARTGRD